MNKWQKDVLEFQIKFKNFHQNKLCIPSNEVIEFRKNLIKEEVVDELLSALDKKDLEKIADGITDSIYVLLGTAIAFGIDIEPIWNEVHRSNMEKVSSGDELKKVTKPKDWNPPNILKLLKEQGYKI